MHAVCAQTGHAAVLDHVNGWWMDRWVGAAMHHAMIYK